MGHRLRFYFKKDIVFLSLKMGFFFANSAVPYEMQHYVAFHQGLHCLQKYILKGTATLMIIMLYMRDLNKP